MPRTARLSLPNTPHHIVQRGHNRNAVFVEDRDYQYYWDNLAEWKQTLGLKVYAFCLMTNHIHLIVEPGEYATDIGELMRSQSLIDVLKKLAPRLAPGAGQIDNAITLKQGIDCYYMIPEAENF